MHPADAANQGAIAPVDKFLTEDSPSGPRACRQTGRDGLERPSCMSFFLAGTITPPLAIRLAAPGGKGQRACRHGSCSHPVAKWSGDRHQPPPLTQHGCQKSESPARSCKCLPRGELQARQCASPPGEDEPTCLFRRHERANTGQIRADENGGKQRECGGCRKAKLSPHRHLSRLERSRSKPRERGRRERWGDPQGNSPAAQQPSPGPESLVFTHILRADKGVSSSRLHRAC